jgi:hypothetical protein
VNTQSCVVHTNYFAKNEKAVFDFVENIYSKTVDDIRSWEDINCPKSTNEADIIDNDESKTTEEE